MIKAFVSLVSLICLGLTTVGLSGCSPLALFDALGPRDKGGRLVLKDAAYGEDPRQRLDVFVPRDISSSVFPTTARKSGGTTRLKRKTPVLGCR